MQYGYRLPETCDNMLFLEIYFRPLGPIYFTYPDLCVRPFYPRPVSSPLDSNPNTLVHNFLETLRFRVRKVCGQDLLTTEEQYKMSVGWITASEVLQEYY